MRPAGQYLTCDSTHSPETGIQTYIVGLQHLALPQQAPTSSGQPDMHQTQSLNSLPWADPDCSQRSILPFLLLIMMRSMAICQQLR